LIILRLPFNIFSRKFLSALEKLVGYRFKNRRLLDIALTHRSAADTQTDSYERLEFLGDSVLNLVVSEYLYKHFPDQSEGLLTKTRSMLVNADTLHSVALTLKLNDFLNIDKSINLDQVSTQRNLLSCTLEALIGAIYLDGGLSAATSLVQRFIISGKIQTAALSQYNYKGQLLEYCQKNGIEMPEFRIEKVEGPDHAPQYIIAVYINNEKRGIGKGATKRLAEQQASKKAYKALVFMEKD